MHSDRGRGKEMVIYTELINSAFSSLHPPCPTNNVLRKNICTYYLRVKVISQYLETRKTLRHRGTVTVNSLVF